MNQIFKKLAQKYRDPRSVQLFLKTFKYNTGPTMKSALSSLKAKNANCMEGAFVAAAILEHHGYPPLVLSLESQDGVDHVLFAFKKNNLWGCIGQSRDPGLYGRPPRFRSIRNLAWSYFDPYIDDTGKVTAYQLANLDDCDSDWRWSHRNVWKAEKYLLELPHKKLVSSQKRYKKLLTKAISGESLSPEPYWW
jgi:hypothetical protein